MISPYTYSNILKNNNEIRNSKVKILDFKEILLMSKILMIQKLKFKSINFNVINISFINFLSF